MTTRSTTLTGAGRETLLRSALLGNALFSEITGLALLLLSAPIARFLGIAPSWPLLPIGAALLLFGAQAFILSRSRPLARGPVLAVIALDAAWVIASALLLIGGWLPLSGGGTWTVLVVADVVAAFGVLQYLGLRRARS